MVEEMGEEGEERKISMGLNECLMICPLGFAAAEGVWKVSPGSILTSYNVAGGVRRCLNGKSHLFLGIIS